MLKDKTGKKQKKTLKVIEDFQHETPVPYTHFQHDFTEYQIHIEDDLSCSDTDSTKEEYIPESTNKKTFVKMFESKSKKIDKQPSKKPTKPTKLTAEEYVVE